MSDCTRVVCSHFKAQYFLALPELVCVRARALELEGLCRLRERVMLLVPLEGKMSLGKILSMSLSLRITEVFTVKLLGSFFHLVPHTPNNFSCQEMSLSPIHFISFHSFIEQISVVFFFPV